MENRSSTLRLPVTQLRPLHTYQQSQQSSDGETFHWTSSFEPRPDEKTAVQTFVKLASQLIVLDEGESFCIHDSRNGGYILARSTPTKNIEIDETAKCDDGQDIPTDFSIGAGKASIEIHSRENVLTGLSGLAASHRSKWSCSSASQVKCNPRGGSQGIGEHV